MPAAGGWPVDEIRVEFTIPRAASGYNRAPANMLRTLSVRGFALLEDVTVDFQGGLNVVTGETGAGKSLLVHAICFLLGDRADASRIRTGVQEASVEGIFEIPEGRARDEVNRLVEERIGTRPEDGLLALTRILDATGRTRAFVCNRFLTREALREIASHLVTVHGQKEHSTLVRPSIQRDKLDTFAGLDAVDGLRARFARMRGSSVARFRELYELRRAERERLDRLDLLRFQAGEIRNAGIRNGELQKLKEEFQTLSNAEKIRYKLSQHLDALHESDGSAIERVTAARRAIQELASLAPVLLPVASRVEEARLLLEDAAREARSLCDSLDADPARLSEVTERIDKITRVLDRFKVDEAGALALLEGMDQEITQLSGAGARGEALESELKASLDEMFVVGCKLTAARAAAAPKLASAVAEALAGLEMKRAEFRVVLREVAAVSPAAEDAARTDSAPHSGSLPEPELLIRSNAAGFDEITFEIAPNPGEPARPIGDIASGGELARVALAIESACAGRVLTPIILFDEIDENVGGRLGPAIGAHLRKVAGPRQVLCITHLAGVAACADHHLFVKKEVRAGRTQTAVDSLDFEGRTAELAAMIAGDAASATALAEARALLLQMNPVLASTAAPAVAPIIVRDAPAAHGTGELKPRRPAGNNKNQSPDRVIIHKHSSRPKKVAE